MSNFKTIIGFMACAVALLVGCSSMTIVFTDSSALSAGTFEIGDVPIPAVSYSTGPRFMSQMGKEGTRGFHFIGSASLTNHTEALGIYKSDESKHLELNATVYQVSPTNPPPDNL